MIDQQLLLVDDLRQLLDVVADDRDLFPRRQLEHRDVNVSLGAEHVIERLGADLEVVHLRRRQLASAFVSGHLLLVAGVHSARPSSSRRRATCVASTS